MLLTKINAIIYGLVDLKQIHPMKRITLLEEVDFTIAEGRLGVVRLEVLI